ncbi:MAG: NAD(P)-dependent oxidoreductase [Bilophila wadsworthia]
MGCHDQLRHAKRSKRRQPSFENPVKCDAMKVCFLGLGSMGSGVCRNLLNKGYALQVWNRSPEKAAKVAGWGAEAFATPQEATRGAGVVMSCLSSVAALKAVAGGANGVFSCMGEGMAFYDMGTWDIESVLALDAEAERHGVRYVHMPMARPAGVPCSSVAWMWRGIRRVSDKGVA